MGKDLQEVYLILHEDSTLMWYSEWGDLSPQDGVFLKDCPEMIAVGQVSIFLKKSFYYIKYGLSVITSKIPSKIISNKNKKTCVSRKIVCFGILIHVLSWRRQKHQYLYFHYWDFLTNFWGNNWQFIFDVAERLCLKVKKYQKQIISFSFLPKTVKILS